MNKVMVAIFAIALSSLAGCVTDPYYGDRGYYRGGTYYADRGYPGDRSYYANRSYYGDRNYGYQRY